MRRQDIGVLLFYFLGYSHFRNILVRLQQKPITRIVTFHDVLPEELVPFKTNLFFLKNNTNVISLDDFFSGRLVTNKINTIITFDDGYKGWVQYALSILKELDLPATFFVSSGFVDLTNADEAEFIRSKLFVKLGSRQITGCLNSEDIRKLAVADFALGGHTLNHTNLENLRDIGYLRHEIAEDKMQLESMIGGRIDYFSYPSGACRNPLINLTKILEEVGYKGAVTTVSGFNTAGSNRYLLCRELTSASMPAAVFRARVYGNYDAVQFIRNIVRGLTVRNK